MLLQRTTNPSRAFIYKTAGGSNWFVSQPVALQSIPQSAVPAEVDTWVSTNSVNLLTPVSVNVVEFAPTIGDFNGGFTNVGYLTQLVDFDPSGNGPDNIYLSNVWAADVSFQRTVTPSEGPIIPGVSAAFSELPIFANCAFPGGLVWIPRARSLASGLAS